MPDIYFSEIGTGKEFDNTREQNGGKPLVFEVGKPEVILGVDDGIIGMKKGEIRRLRLPPRLGWGEGGTTSVPSGQIMVMDIELLSINGQ